MIEYDSNLTLQDALKQYFARNRFGDDGGYQQKWVKLKLGGLVLFIPNTKGRVKAVRFHDLHHIATNYQTDLKGESEISAWELASGCTNHPAAWLLNVGAFSMGLVLWPRCVYQAFLRGRKSKNLYHHSYDEKLLAMQVGELKHQLELDGTDLVRHVSAQIQKRSLVKDKVIFLLFSLLGLVWMPLVAILFPFILLFSLVLSYFGKKSMKEERT